jgi:hypothetical protein
LLVSLQSSAIDTPDWHAYKKAHPCGQASHIPVTRRHLVALSGHIESQSEQQSQEPEPDPDISGELNDLNDGEVNQLMLATKREFVRAVKAGLVAARSPLSGDSTYPTVFLAFSLRA